MATTTSEGAAMTTIPETDAQTAARLRMRGWTERRILSGLGHPGYGEDFAARALLRVERYGMTAGEAVYGGVEADRKVEAAR
jgi:hypothetical protein